MAISVYAVAKVSDQHRVSMRVGLTRFLIGGWTAAPYIVGDFVGGRADLAI